MFFLLKCPFIRFSPKTRTRTLFRSFRPYLLTLRPNVPTLPSVPTNQSIIDGPQKPVSKDWHKIDIICSLWRLGTNLQRLSRKNNYARTALCNALYHPWPKAERIIAEALGVPPEQIWPSRYHPDGSPRSGRGERGLGRYKRKASRPASNHSTAAHPRNVKIATEI